ncbi:MAG: hypothetical protein NT068_02295 [Candidatus Nomurabacteria bacterium]|nr:hypothetical protein [Candidatus Nomurabacteria bacterium]
MQITIEKRMKKTKGMSVGKKVAIGAGVAAIGAIGAYAFMGPNGKKNQKKAKVLVNKMVKTEKKIQKDWKNLKTKAGPSLKEFKATVKKVAGQTKKEIKKEVKKAKKVIKKISK